MTINSSSSQWEQWQTQSDSTTTGVIHRRSRHRHTLTRGGALDVQVALRPQRMGDCTVHASHVHTGSIVDDDGDGGRSGHTDDVDNGTHALRKEGEVVVVLLATEKTAKQW